MQEFELFATLASLLSIFIVFMINRWLGGFKPAHLGGEGEALDRLRQDFPIFDAKSTLVDIGGSSAVLAGTDGSVALVEAIGDRFLTRLLQPGDINALFLEPAKDKQGQKLRLQLRDFTNGAFEITLPTGANGTQWHKHLSKFHNKPEGGEDAPEGRRHE